jgi:hypothetical protein
LSASVGLIGPCWERLCNGLCNSQAQTRCSSCAKVVRGRCSPRRQREALSRCKGKVSRRLCLDALARLTRIRKTAYKSHNRVSLLHVGHV